MYAQTILGFSWAILNPLIQIIVFSVIFGRLAGLDSEGYPYFLFSTVAIIPWTYMSNTMNTSSQSLVTGQNMLGKVYFPRIIFPLTPVFARLVDFSISLLLVFAVMAYYQVTPSWNLLYLPIFIAMMIAIPAGIGMWLSSLAIRFRDVKFAMPFIIRMLIYSAPVLYTATLIPEEYRVWYSLNPIVGVIEGFRACFLGTDIPWQYVWPGVLTTILLVVSGAFYFRRMEKIIVDVI
jgi:lipopolysaccharide transport system permease protein